MITNHLGNEIKVFSAREEGSEIGIKLLDVEDALIE